MLDFCDEITHTYKQYGENNLAFVREELIDCKYREEEFLQFLHCSVSKGHLRLVLKASQYLKPIFHTEPNSVTTPVYGNVKRMFWV